LPPPVHIEEVNVDQRSFDLNRVAEAAPGRGDLVFRYTGLSFFAPEKVKFRYKLEGYDTDWVEAGDRRAAYYNNLPPGRYTFRAMAANSDGVWNTTGDSHTIVLAPHFYQTFWFYGVALCALVLAAICAYRLRMGGLRAREQQLGLLIDRR